jgi:hypothetical protein
MDIEFEIHKFK